MNKKEKKRQTSQPVPGCCGRFSMSLICSVLCRKMLEIVSNTLPPKKKSGALIGKTNRESTKLLRDVVRASIEGLLHQCD